MPLMYQLLPNQNLARHAHEYQLLLAWFTRRQHELGLDHLSEDPMDPHPHITRRSTHCVSRAVLA